MEYLSKEKESENYKHERKKANKMVKLESRIL